MQGGQGEEQLLAAVKAAEKLGALDERFADVLDTLASLYLERQKYAEAEPLLQRALAIREERLGPEHPRVAQSLGVLGWVRHRQDKDALAEPLVKRALAIRETTYSPEHPAVVVSVDHLAAIYFAQHKYAEAEPLIKRALRAWRNRLGSQHPYVADSLHRLGALYQAESKNGEAEPLLKQAVEIRTKYFGRDSDLIESLEALAAVYRSQGKNDRAAPLSQRALDIRSRRTEVFWVGEDVSAPVLVSKVEAGYTEEARRARGQGVVVLAIVVDENGQPRDFRVMRPLGLGLDQEAIKAVSKWRFVPGSKDGKRVAVRATVEIRFGRR
jgi:TonB family protein